MHQSNSVRSPGTKIFKVWPVLFAVLLVAGCNPGGSSPDPEGDTDPVDSADGNNEGDTTDRVETIFRARLNNAVSLYALEDSVVESRRLSPKAHRNESIFHYEVVDDAYRARHFGGRQDDTTEPQPLSSNLLGIDASGDASLAIEANRPVEVMYTAVDPAADYVYIVLNSGLDNRGQQEPLDTYGPFVAEQRCALYSVHIESNEMACVGENLYITPYYNDFSDNAPDQRKPIQFDGNGNAYFAGSPFSRRCIRFEGDEHNETSEDDSPKTLSREDEPANSAEEACLEYTLERPGENIVQLYRHNAETGALDALTGDDVQVSGFTSTEGGSVVYHANLLADYSRSVRLYHQGNTINIPNARYGATIDDQNTVISRDQWDDLLVLSRPGENGSLQQIEIRNPWFSLDWLKGDDGKLYGIDENDLHQLLPYRRAPVARLNGNRIEAFGRSLKLHKGYVYYLTEEEVIGYGSVNVINILRVQTGDSWRLLVPADANGAGRYRVSQWQVSGDTVYFAGEDLSNSVSIAGEIDTLSLREGEPESEYLVIDTVASALGTISDIKDIEVLEPVPPKVRTGAKTRVELEAQPEHLSSMSLTFSEYMNKARVEEKLLLEEEATGIAIPYIPLWWDKTLHLFPDTEGRLASGTDTRPLEYDSTYRFGFETDDIVYDIFNQELQLTAQDTTSLTFTTLPEQGWSVIDTGGSSASLTSGNVARLKLIKAPEDSSSPDHIYRLMNVDTGQPEPVDIPTNFRIETSLRTNSGVTIKLYNKTEGEAELVFFFQVPYANYNGRIAHPPADGSRFAGQDIPLVDDHITGQDWRRLRIDVVGGRVTISLSLDGDSFELVHDYEPGSTGENGMRPRDEADIYNLHFETGVYQWAAEGETYLAEFDNWQVQSLDDAGIPQATVFSDDFDVDDIEYSHLVFEHWASQP